MKAKRTLTAVILTAASLTAGGTFADGQDPHMAQHLAQVTWTANLKPLNSFTNSRFAEARAIPLEASATPSVTVSFTCECPIEAGTIVVATSDPTKIHTALLRQMRFWGDTDGPLLMDIMNSNPVISGGVLKAQIPTGKFPQVSNVVLNGQCMAIVTLAGGTTLAGPVVMLKTGM